MAKLKNILKKKDKENVKWLIVAAVAIVLIAVINPQYLATTVLILIVGFAFFKLTGRELDLPFIR